MSEPKIIRHTLDSSGVDILITPVSPFTFRAIRQKAFELYPDPDEAPYRLPIENAAIPGDTRPAHDHPEYVRLVGEQARKRTDYISSALIEVAVEPVEGRDVLVERYAAKRANLAQWIELPADPWQATLLYCVVLGKEEPQIIIDAASGDLPLTPEEVEEGVGRFFRLELQRKTASRLVG